MSACSAATADPSARFSISNSPFATGLSGAQHRDGLAAGFGVGYKKADFGLGMDYAWRSMGVLGGTIILSFSVQW